MAGETREKVSGWTTDTLKAYVEQVLAERDRRYDERFQSAQKAVVIAETNLTDLMNERFRSAAEAVTLAQVENERRLVGLNELRREVTNDRDQLLTRAVFDVTIKEWSMWREGLIKDIALLQTRLTVIETRSITWTAALGIFFAAVQIVLFWITHK